VRVAPLLVIAAGLAIAAPVSAAPSGRIASHCSASGDVCYGIFDDRGVIRFQLTLAARYFTRYRICVRPPRGATTCKSFPVKRVGSQFGGAVRWERNFPVRGTGRYRVTWKQGAQALGPGLTFRRIEINHR
jgi:hypothetical protein